MKLTDEAATMISHMVKEEDLPPGAGLRIAQRDDHVALAMSLADDPESDDVVVGAGDARVFLAPVADARLSDETLDARTGEQGAAFFVQP